MVIVAWFLHFLFVLDVNVSNTVVTMHDPI